MIVWMLFSMFVALIVAAAARAAESLARLAGYRVRWIWSGALSLTVFLSASAALRGTAPALPTAWSPTIDLNETAHMQADASWRGALSVRFERLRLALDAPLQSGVATVRRVVSPTANLYAASLSSLISFGLVLVLVGVGRRFRSARREWPLVMMHGVGVRVAPCIGPAVIGFVRPEIVVPRWLLARCVEEQRLVVTHEHEHVRARDPLLLGFGWGAVVVAPWNPAVWYMLSRMRLAVELDCDARVLRRGAVPQSYGALLIDVAQHASVLRLSALALADDPSHLHQRILAMTPHVPRFARLRAGLAAAFALAGVLVACQATLPTNAESEPMDAAATTGTAPALARTKHADTTVASTIDSAKAAISEVSALASSAIGRLQRVPRLSRKPTQVDVDMRKPAVGIKRDARAAYTSLAAAGDSGLMQRAPLMDGTAGQVDTVPGWATLPSVTGKSFTPLIFIDGVRATVGEMRSLDRTQIETVDVLKGPYAEQDYNDPEAAKGVVVITTKRSGGMK